VSAYDITPSFSQERYGGLLTELQERNQRLKILSDVANLLLLADNPRDVIETVFDRLSVHLGLEFYFNYLLVEDGSRLRLANYRGILPETAKEIEWLDFGQAVCGCVARDRTRIVAEDVQYSEDEQTDLIQSLGITAYCCHPLIAHDKLIGTLSFGTRDRARFTPDEIELMRVVCNLTASALERHKYENSLRASEERLQRASRALTTLARCKKAMIRTEDEATLLADICHIIVDDGGYRLAWIGYIEDDPARTVRPVARAGYDDGYVDSLKIALNDPVRGSGPTGVSLKSGKPYGSRNVRQDSVMQPWRAEALKRGYLSTLNLPLMYQGQILGTIVIYSGSSDAFDDEELGLLTDLADNLAFGILAIRNRAKRYQFEQELLRAKEELEARVEKRTEELKSAKEQAELYLDLMGHDINNMNHAAMGFLELAVETLEAENRLKVEDKVLIDRPLASLQSSSMLIANVQMLQRLMKDGVKMKPVDIGSIFKEIDIDSLPHGDREINIKIPEVQNLVVEGDELLRDVFLNLITNAIKHSDEEKSLAIDVKVEPVQDNGKKYYRCVVEDNGPGIPDDLKPKLFHRFKRGTTKAHGKGLGLYLVRTLIESYGARVWVEDRVPGDHTKGARFVVMLPAAEQ
jgi:GAF domain-containing protein